MAHIVAPAGSALGAAIIGSEHLERSREFYVDCIGFAAGPVEHWSGVDFERWWSLPPGSRARTCLLTANSCAVGRVLLVEFDSPGRTLVQPVPNSQVIGLANLNFYTADARAAVDQLRARGYRFWTEPTQHSLDAGVGNPIEVIFDGPDGVAMNLVQLTSLDETTRIGQMHRYVQGTGYTRQGFTPVVTSSHVARSLERCCEFYEQVCGMGRLFADQMTADHVNAFLRLPRGALTRIVFMQGNHMYGKIAVSGPVNYLEQCADLTPSAHAPNIGYLAQWFEVADLAAALAAAARLASPIVSSPRRLHVPGIGVREQALLRNPGSGALMWLAQSSD